MKNYTIILENNTNNIEDINNNSLVEDRDLMLDNMNKEQLESLRDMVMGEQLEDNSRGFKR